MTPYQRLDRAIETKTGWREDDIQEMEKLEIQYKCQQCGSCDDVMIAFHSYKVCGKCRRDKDQDEYFARQNTILKSLGFNGDNND